MTPPPAAAASAQPKLKILCLCGFLQSSAIFSARMGALRRSVKGFADMHFLEPVSTQSRAPSQPASASLQLLSADVPPSAAHPRSARRQSRTSQRHTRGEGRGRRARPRETGGSSSRLVAQQQVRGRRIGQVSPPRRAARVHQRSPRGGRTVRWRLGIQPGCRAGLDPVGVAGGAGRHSARGVQDVAPAVQVCRRRGWV